MTAGFSVFGPRSGSGLALSNDGVGAWRVKQDDAELAGPFPNPDAAARAAAQLIREYVQGRPASDDTKTQP